MRYLQQIYRRKDIGAVNRREMMAHSNAAEEKQRTRRTGSLQKPLRIRLRLTDVLQDGGIGRMIDSAAVSSGIRRVFEKLSTVVDDILKDFRQRHFDARQISPLAPPGYQKERQRVIVDILPQPVIIHEPFVLLELHPRLEEALDRPDVSVVGRHVEVVVPCVVVRVRIGTREIVERAVRVGRVVLRMEKLGRVRVDVGFEPETVLEEYAKKLDEPSIACLVPVEGVFVDRRTFVTKQVDERREAIIVLSVWICTVLEKTVDHAGLKKAARVMKGRGAPLIPVVRVDPSA